MWRKLSWVVLSWKQSSALDWIELVWVETFNCIALNWFELIWKHSSILSWIEPINHTTFQRHLSWHVQMVLHSLAQRWRGVDYHHRAHTQCMFVVGERSKTTSRASTQKHIQVNEDSPHSKHTGDAVHIESDVVWWPSSVRARPRQK